MITIKRTNSDNIDFIKLVKELDKSLGVYYKDEKSFYEELNNIDKIKYAVVAYNENEKPVGCGGIKKYSKNEVEIKRIFVPTAYRGKGIATIVLKELENWSKDLEFEKCILETLKEKPYAIAFYEKNKYKEIPNFGEYKNAENSICFEKEIK
ncbi:GNAT family N-acetyltransferase [Polaribacter sp. Z014]|uniref:GNAT family N-acetyltransferase n=1 Tax=Polaribacter sp. Z014 TaxID=2927126 RepID=UPI0020203314|nr:GNAT family N-acetyltransferase [Polaribacter sp. Z014]MCL7763612.1 GNAT family N-acetyltransferase [Polaribacter sp. Z014]